MKISLLSICLVALLAHTCLGEAAGPEVGIPRLVTYPASDNCDWKGAYYVAPLLPAVLGNSQNQCVNVSYPGASFMQRWTQPYMQTLVVDTMTPRCSERYISEEILTGICQNTTSYSNGPSSQMILAPNENVVIGYSQPKPVKPAPMINSFHVPTCQIPKYCAAPAWVTYYNDQYCRQANYTQAIVAATLLDGSPTKKDVCYTEPAGQARHGESFNNIQFSCSMYEFTITRSLNGCKSIDSTKLSTVTYKLDRCVQTGLNQWAKYGC